MSFQMSILLPKLRKSKTPKTLENKYMKKDYKDRDFLCVFTKKDTLITNTFDVN